MTLVSSPVESLCNIPIWCHLCDIQNWLTVSFGESSNCLDGPSLSTSMDRPSLPSQGSPLPDRPSPPGWIDQPSAVVRGCRLWSSAHHHYLPRISCRTNPLEDAITVIRNVNASPRFMHRDRWRSMAASWPMKEHGCIMLNWGGNEIGCQRKIRKKRSNRDQQRETRVARFAGLT